MNISHHVAYSELLTTVPVPTDQQAASVMTASGRITPAAAQLITWA